MTLHDDLAVDQSDDESPKTKSRSVQFDDDTADLWLYPRELIFLTLCEYTLELLLRNVINSLCIEIVEVNCGFCNLSELDLILLL